MLVVGYVHGLGALWVCCFWCLIVLVLLEWY